jgi:uncharacterized membrane protein
MRVFFRTTLVGGAVFLIPLVIALLLLGYAVNLAREIIQPILQMLEIHLPGPIGGVGMITIVAIVFLLLVSFLAGIFARTRSGVRLMDRVDNSLLGRLPQYRIIKSMAGTLSRSQSAGDVRAGLVRMEEGWQLCCVLETLENGWLTVLLPQAPNPMAGTIAYYPPEHVRLLGMSIVQAASLIQALGIGSAAQMRGSDFCGLAEKV